MNTQGSSKMGRSSDEEICSTIKEQKEKASLQETTGRDWGYESLEAHL